MLWRWQWCARLSVPGILPVQRNLSQDFGQESRLVEALLWLRTKAARQQIGCVAFEHQAAFGDVAYQRVKMGAAALVANPARDTDVQVQIR